MTTACANLTLMYFIRRAARILAHHSDALLVANRTGAYCGQYAKLWAVVGMNAP